VWCLYARPPVSTRIVNALRLAIRSSQLQMNARQPRVTSVGCLQGPDRLVRVAKQILGRPYDPEMVGDVRIAWVESHGLLRQRPSSSSRYS